MSALVCIHCSCSQFLVPSLCPKPWIPLSSFMACGRVRCTFLSRDCPLSLYPRLWHCPGQSSGLSSVVCPLVCTIGRRQSLYEMKSLANCGCSHEGDYEILVFPSLSFASWPPFLSLNFCFQVSYANIYFCHDVFHFYRLKAMVPNADGLISP